MVNLLTARRTVAYDLDDLLLASALAGSTFNSVGAFLLASSETGLAVSRFNGRWIYHVLPTLVSGQQRRVSKDSYVPATGFVSVQPGWNAPASGSALELTGLFPCDTPPFGSDTSYRSIINEALRLLLIGDRITLPISTSQVYTLPTWLTREDRIVLTGDADNMGPRPSLWEPAPFGDAPVNAAWRRPRFVRDGGANLLILDVPFSTASGSLSLDVLRPADTLIAPALTGAFADSTTGLVNDGDQISPQIELSELAAVAKMVAYEVLANRGDDPTWRKAWATQVPIAQSQPHFDRGAAREVPDRQSGEAA